MFIEVRLYIRDLYKRFLEVKLKFKVKVELILNRFNHLR